MNSSNKKFLVDQKTLPDKKAVIIVQKIEFSRLGVDFNNLTRCEYWNLLDKQNLSMFITFKHITAKCRFYNNI